jgi:hypothetical protein
VDFRRGKVRQLFVPPPGEEIQFASRREDEREKWSMFFVGTDKAVHFLDQTGKPLLAAPLAYDLTTNRVFKAVAMGYRRAGALRTESAIDPLRGRDDFRLLMLDLAMLAEPFAR